MSKDIKTLLIDGDELCYISALSGQTKWYIAKIGDRELFRGNRKSEVIQHIGNSNNIDIEEYIEDLTKDAAIARSITWLNEVYKGTETLEGQLEPKVYFSGDNNFRKSLATILPYKGNRSDGARPIHLPFMKEYISDKFNCESVEYLEADDLLAINQTDDTIIVTQDKDLNMVPGYRYFTNKQELKLLEPDYCTRFFYMQLLTGDATDNIPGLSWVGDKIAMRILGDSTDPLELYEIVYEEYNKRITNGEHLVAKGSKKGEVLWTSGKTIGDIIWEIGNLLYMRREIGEDKYWDKP